MIMYRVLVDFKDLKDGGYQYKAGDVYPRNGETDKKRVMQLMSSTPQRGSLIEQVEDKPAEIEVTEETKKSKRKKTE